MRRSGYRIASVGRRGVTIMNEEGGELHAVVAGKVYRNITPVAGDMVEVEENGGSPVVVKVLPRRNELKRTSPRGRVLQVIAANVDRVLAICSLRNPPFSHDFLGRALVGAEWMGLASTVVLNKADLCTEPDEREDVSEIRAVYENAGYPVFIVSCVTGAGTGELLEHIAGKTVVMTGQSGAGKTSLAGRFVPSLDLRIGDVSPKTRTGRHTTVSARMIRLPENTYLIDTPGLRIFAIDHVPADGIPRCFPEFGKYSENCRFRNCMHLHEPGCAVKEAVKQEKIPITRYKVYTRLVRETREKGRF